MSAPSPPGSPRENPSDSSQNQRERTLSVQGAPSPRLSAATTGATTRPAVDAQRGVAPFPDFKAFGPSPDALARAIGGKPDNTLSALISNKLQAHQEMHADLFKAHAGAFQEIAARHGGAQHETASAAGVGGNLQAHPAFSAMHQTAQAIHGKAMNKINQQLSELKPVSKWRKT